MNFGRLQNSHTNQQLTLLCSSGTLLPLILTAANFLVPLILMAGKRKNFCKIFLVSCKVSWYGGVPPKEGVVHAEYYV